MIALRTIEDSDDRRAKKVFVVGNLGPISTGASIGGIRTCRNKSSRSSLLIVSEFSPKGRSIDTVEFDVNPLLCGLRRILTVLFPEACAICGRLEDVGVSHDIPTAELGSSS